MFKNIKGFILIASYLIIVVLIILGAAFISRNISESRLAEREKNFIQSLYLAEAGIDDGLTQLRAGTSSGNSSNSLSGIGNYNCTWALIAGHTDKWEIVSTGTLGSISRMVRVELIKQAMPANFFDNSLYVGGDISFNGNAYDVNGSVLYSGTLTGDASHVVPNPPVQDPAISPLVRLDFAALRQLSQSQGNVYDALRLKTDSLPDSFWYDEAAGTPNIVYVETDLTLNGNIGTVGGFFVVVGDVISNPLDVEDTTINGNGQIEGCIYTTGEFTVNGGGNGINVLGGVWAGQEATLNGSVNITYNPTYMDALEGLSLSADFQIISWQEL